MDLCVIHHVAIDFICFVNCLNMKYMCAILCLTIF